MLSRDFCFWLQGFFEIGQADFISSRQADIINRHLNLVKESEGELSGVCLYVRALTKGEGDIPKDTVRNIRKLIDAEFEHVIDPATPGNQDTMNQIHNVPLHHDNENPSPHIRPPRPPKGARC